MRDSVFEQVMCTYRLPKKKKKKLLQWAGPGQDADSLVPQLLLFSSNQHQCDMDAILIRNNRADTRVGSRSADKCRVEPTRCTNLHAGSEKALQCRHSSVMGNTVRTFCCRTGAALPLHFFFSLAREPIIQRFY